MVTQPTNQPTKKYSPQPFGDNKERLYKAAKNYIDYIYKKYNNGPTPEQLLKRLVVLSGIPEDKVKVYLNEFAQEDKIEIKEKNGKVQVFFKDKGFKDGESIGEPIETDFDHIPEERIM